MQPAYGEAHNEVGGDKEVFRVIKPPFDNGTDGGVLDVKLKGRSAGCKLKHDGWVIKSMAYHIVIDLNVHDASLAGTIHLTEI
jgi:hypothetical protein